MLFIILFCLAVVIMTVSNLSNLRLFVPLWTKHSSQRSHSNHEGDPATEQYLQIEGLDQHDHPKFTMRWR